MNADDRLDSIRAGELRAPYVVTSFTLGILRAPASDLPLGRCPSPWCAGITKLQRIAASGMCVACDVIVGARS